MRTYQDLSVWRKSIDLVEDIYKLSKDFPPEEKFGLTSQIRRAAISLSSNIAEGCGRETDKDFIHFLDMSMGSLNELETQYIIAQRIWPDFKFKLEFYNRTMEDGKMIYGLKKSLKPHASSLMPSERRER